MEKKNVNVKNVELANLRKELAGLKELGRGVQIGKGGRKAEVLSLLREGRKTVKELGKVLGISEKNIGSIFKYLRDDGNVLIRDSLGKYEYRGNTVEIENKLKEMGGSEE